MASENYKNSSLNTGYSDQSHLVGDVGNALIGGESMSDGNTTNHPATTVGPAPGSMPVNLPLKGPASKMDSPELEIPKTGSKLTTGVKKGG